MVGSPQIIATSLSNDISANSDRQALAQVSPPIYDDLQLLYLSKVRIGAELGVEPKLILATSHGRRSIDVIKLYDPSKANWECKYSPALRNLPTIDPTPRLTVGSNRRQLHRRPHP
jgi:hypothetical protein